MTDACRLAVVLTLALAVGCARDRTPPPRATAAGGLTPDQARRQQQLRERLNPGWYAAGDTARSLGR